MPDITSGISIDLNVSAVWVYILFCFLKIFMCNAKVAYLIDLNQNWINKKVLKVRKRLQTLPLFLPSSDALLRKSLHHNQLYLRSIRSLHATEGHKPQANKHEGETHYMPAARKLLLILFAGWAFFLLAKLCVGSALALTSDCQSALLARKALKINNSFAMRRISITFA